jgi:hypothetical protein
MDHTQRCDLVVNELAHRLGMLDSLPVDTGPLGHLPIATQAEAQGTQAHLSCLPEAIGLAARDPQRREGASALVFGMTDRGGIR